MQAVSVSREQRRQFLLNKLLGEAKVPVFEPPFTEKFQDMYAYFCQEFGESVTERDFYEDLLTFELTFEFFHRSLIHFEANSDLAARISRIVTKGMDS